MKQANVIMAANDDIWTELRQEAAQAAGREPALQSLLHAAILDQHDIGAALAHLLGRRLGGQDLPPADLAALYQDACQDDNRLVAYAMRDIQAWMSRDPACRSYLQPFLFFKGFAALQCHRLAHWLWRQERQHLAYHLQSRSAEIFQVDIHPAAELGSGIFLDHATGIVIGETSVIGDDVSMLQSVTLGGNGKERGDRHPKIARGVLIGAGAKILGNINVGEEARIAAGSVVLQDVPAHVTVAGVPARPVGEAAPPHPAECMDHSFTI